MHNGELESWSVCRVATPVLAINLELERLNV
jgi:hypothetical protein